ncbi:hypothetical protein P7K49_009299 [Saguinus oedipus]|uniref:Uncharacterized protein n=1 Tax=Saguinus oedipus TaxID=9490 RepID=A0ABQ9VLV0_SAGOE|nr:hypothetical protein P7K49_009299 [Saguinus oedipus]
MGELGQCRGPPLSQFLGVLKKQETPEQTRCAQLAHPGSQRALLGCDQNLLGVTGFVAVCVMPYGPESLLFPFHCTGPPDADGPLYLPYKTLVSTVGSMVFNEGEAQRLIEILSEKAGIIQDTWHKATQKGDPVAILKRQLEEKEKLLATEQEDAAVAKSKLRELNKVQPEWAQAWLVLPCPLRTPTPSTVDPRL